MINQSIDLHEQQKHELQKQNGNQFHELQKTTAITDTNTTA